MTRALEIGSGYSPSLGFEHLDANPNAPLVDWVLDAAEPLPFEDGAFGAIKAFDVLEHIAHTATVRVLAEWARILVPGGTLDLMVPDAERIMARHTMYAAAGEDAGKALAEREGWIPEHLRDRPLIASAVWRLFGGLDDGERVLDGDDPDLNLHRQAFSESSLRWHLEHAGLFTVVRMEHNAHPNLICRAVREVQ